MRSLVALPGATLLVCLTVLVAPARAVYRPADPSERFGVNASQMFWYMQNTDLNGQSRRMHDYGIRTARIDAPWNVVQPSASDGANHVYHWDSLDRIVGVLAGNGVRALPMVGYSASWAASSPGNLMSPPRDPGAYAAYARAVVARYEPGGSFWRSHPSVPRVPITAVEIWNEPNWPHFWQPRPDAAGYLRLYETARNAVHAENPRIQAIVGGLTVSPASFVQAMYAAGGDRRGMFDAVGVHPYGGDPAGAMQRIVTTRRALDGHGDVDTPIDATEFGWPSLRGFTLLRNPVNGPAYVPDSQRAGWYTQLVDDLMRSDCGVERVLPYDWTSPMQDPNDSEQWYGLVSPSGAPTATAAAYAGSIGRLGPLGNPTHAALVRCGRALRVRTFGYTQRRKVRRGGRKVVRRKACFRVRTTAAGSPTTRTPVFVDRLRAGRARRLSVRVTDAAGRSTTCLAARRGQRITFRVTAHRQDFTNIAGASRTVRVKR